MMVIVLAFLQTPHVEIAPRSMARRLLVPSKSDREPLGLAAWGGFGDLRKHLLAKGDEEVRVWYGSGISNLWGVILQKRTGVWKAIRLIGGFGDRRHPSSRVAYARPKSGWPVFWRKAEALGLWSLPDESTLPKAGSGPFHIFFFDVVEYQRSGTYRAYVYESPEIQEQWAEAAKMVAIGKLLDAEFPVPAKLSKRF